MTDREVMIALYKAIEQLYLELIGKPLSISVETGNGRMLIQSLGGTSEARISEGTAAQAA
ncbi:hypothetical protein [Sphingomonas sp.]|uniref:hypothetical protein n=1 Tax=Sphingomonas sp. TaxID=28214 RepID=UPI0038A8F925